MISFKHSSIPVHCALAILVACIGGCFVSSPTPERTPKASPADISTPSPGATASPSAVPHIVTSTSSPMPLTHTPVSTGIPIPTDTLSPSTVAPDEERAFVKEMLATNGGCELPCWWGITPGKSDWQSTIDFFGAHGGFQLIVLSVEGLYEYEVFHTVVERDGIVQSIEVLGNTRWDNPSQSFTQDWSHYSLDQVLARHGTPSRVRVVLNEYGGGGGPFYVLLVFYDDLGVGIRYHGHALRENDLFRVCFSFTDIALWLQPPGELPPLHENVDPDEWLYSVSLQEATGMNVEEFWRAFQQPGRCLEASATTP
jgi:hypothetical protein